MSRAGSIPLRIAEASDSSRWDTLSSVLPPPNELPGPFVARRLDGAGGTPQTFGAERWLGSPIRLAILAGIAVVVATAATSIGTIELRSAGGIDEGDIDVLRREGALSLLWALATPAFLWIAVRLGRALRPWPLLIAAHAATALIVGSLFLCAEIKLVETGQTKEQTERYAQYIKSREDRSTAFRRDEGGRGERPERGPRGERPGSGRDGDGRMAPHRRWRGRSAGLTQASGNLGADFRRRFPLRVPRYALVYFFLVGIGLGIRAYLNGRRQERHAARLERDLAHARLAALRGQLHPHFLFNALHSVGGLIRTSRGDDALTALASIGDLLRTSLDAQPEQFVPLEREVELIRRYLEVESLRLGDRLKILVDVPSGLLPAEVPTFIAQPLVENAIKHAVANRANGGAITFRARQEEGLRLILEVEDDGPGFHPNADHQGVGITHARQRLEALFGASASLDVETRNEGGTRARLTLPLDDLEEMNEAGPGEA